MTGTHVTPGARQRGDADSISLYGVRFRFVLRADEARQSLSIVEVEIPPKTLVKPHRHRAEDEYTLVLSGTLGVRLGDEELSAGPGTYLRKPRGVPHAIWNAGSETAQILEILVPGGFERYFEEIEPILERGQGDSAAYEMLAERYGVEILDDWTEELEAAHGVALRAPGYQPGGRD